MREWHWKREKSYPNPNPLVAFCWRFNGGDFGKLGEEKTCEVCCYLELGGLNYTGRYRLRRFIVIRVLQPFILVDFFRRVVKGEVFMPGARVFLFHNTLWCYGWLTCGAILPCLCSVVS